jgi:hypothetical protein
MMPWNSLFFPIMFLFGIAFAASLFVLEAIHKMLLFNSIVFSNSKTPPWSRHLLLEWMDTKKKTHRETTHWLLSFLTSVLSDICPFRHLSFQTSVLSDFCPFRLLSIQTSVLSDFCPFRLLSFQTSVLSDFCPFRHLSFLTSVLSDICPFRHLSFQTSVLSDICPFWLLSFLTCPFRLLGFPFIAIISWRLRHF